MAPSENNKDGAVWLVIVLGLVMVTAILIAALILGPGRATQSRADLRLERPTLPFPPKSPNPPRMPRQVD